MLNLATKIMRKPPPAPNKPIAAKAIEFGDQNTLFISVANIEQLPDIIDQCREVGRIEKMQDAPKAFYCHVYINYTSDQMPDLIEWVESM